jgi:hypothetical protein
MSRQFTTKEIATNFIEHLENLAAYWPKQNIKEIQEYDNLDGLVHSIYAAIAGSTLALPGFLIVPFNPINYPENEGIKKQLEQNILPTSIKLFAENNQEVLSKYKNLFNIKSINYHKELGLDINEEKNDDNFNALLIRNVWQHTEYWYSQDMPKNDKMICLIKTILDIFNGKDLIDKTKLVPYLTQEDKEYFKSEGENYYSSVNAELLNTISFVSGGNAMHQQMWSFRPEHDNEKSVKEKYILNNNLKSTNKQNKIKM